MADDRDLLREILDRLGSESSAQTRTRTSLLLDLRQEIAVIQASMAILVADRERASGQQDKLLDRLDSIDRRVATLEVAVTPRDIADVAREKLSDKISAIDRRVGDLEAGWRIWFSVLAGGGGLIAGIAALWNALRHP